MIPADCRHTTLHGVNDRYFCDSCGVQVALAKKKRPLGERVDDFLASLLDGGL